MFTRKYYLPLAFFLLYQFCSVSFAQTQKIDQFTIDCAEFAYNDSTNLVEIYYAVSPMDFTLRSVAPNLMMKFRLSVAILNIALNREVFSETDTMNITISKDTTQWTVLAGKVQHALPPGNYKITAFVRDEYDTLRTARSVIEWKNLPLPQDRFCISDLLFASSLTKVDEKKTVFYKNTFEAVPSVYNVLHESQPIAMYYSELYNLNINIGVEEIKTEASIFDDNNTIVRRYSKWYPRKYANIVDTGSIDLTGLKTGAYTLVVAMVDSIKKLSYMQSKRFYYIAPSIKDTMIARAPADMYLASEFVSMGDEELNESYATSKYIASRAEQDQWLKITEIDAKRKFLFTFWKMRDASPETPENEFKQEYQKRLFQANEKYSTLRRKGWLTDRGRVLLMYGEPSEIERYPNEIDSKPYEIWHYNNLEGGVQFVFADLTGFSDYQLLHSTLRGELRDDNWSRKVKTM